MTIIVLECTLKLTNLITVSELKIKANILNCRIELREVTFCELHSDLKFCSNIK